MTTAKYDELVQKLTDAKVKLKDVNGEYRSTYDIMADIAAKWDTMSSMEQSAMATALAGTRQQAVFFSIIDQFKEASGAMDQMRNSSGELSEAYSTYMDSAQAKTNQFKAAFQEFSTNFFSSKFIGNLIEGGTYLLDILGHMAKIGTLLPTIISSVAVFKAFKMTELFSKLNGQINTISNQILNERVSVDALVISTSNLNTQQKEAIVNATLRKTKGDEVATAMAKERMEIIGLINGESQLAKANNEVNTSAQAATASENQLAQASDTAATSAQTTAVSEQQVAQANNEIGTSAQVAAVNEEQFAQAEAVAGTSAQTAAVGEQRAAQANDAVSASAQAATASENQLVQANNAVGSSAQATSGQVSKMGSAMGGLKSGLQSGLTLLSTTLSTLTILKNQWGDIKEILDYFFGIGDFLEKIDILGWLESDEPSEAKRNIKEVETELKQLSESAVNTAKTFSSLKTSADEVIPRYVQLAQGVDAFGKNINLSEEQYSEYISLNNKLAEMFPSINMGMDTNGNAMLRLSGNAEELTKKLNDLVEAQRKVANQEIASKLPDAIKDINELNTQVDNAKTQYANLSDERWKKTFNIIKDKPEISKTNIFRTEEEAEENLKRNNQLRRYAAQMGVTSKQELKGDYYHGFYYEIKWNYEKYDPEKARQVYEDGLNQNERIIKDANERIKERWKSINPMLIAWMETDFNYNELSDKMQDVAKTMVSGIDFESLGLKTEDDIKNYVSKYIIAPLVNSSDDTKAAFGKIANWQDQLKKGEISSEEFTSKVKSAFSGLKGSMDPAVINAFVQGFKAAGIEGDTFDQIVENLALSWSKVSEVGTAALTDLSDSLTNLKTKLDVIAQAQADMFNGDVTADTIKAIKDAIGEDKSVSYLDFLYEEGDAIKFNIEKWKEYSQIEINGNREAIQGTIDKLTEERTKIQDRITDLNNATVKDKNWQEQLESENDKLRENTSEIEANQNKLSIYDKLYSSATERLDAYSTALDNFKNVSNTITKVSDSLTTVADLQERVRKGFTLSLEEALKFADVYPEILDSATVSADGQINLNSNIVNSFIRGKESELRAEVQTKIKKLEAEKEVITAKKNFAEAQLKIVKSVGEGEGKISAESAAYRIEISNILVKKLMDNGYTEAQANAKACEAMDNNYVQFNNVVGDVAYDIARNMGVSAESIATNMARAMTGVTNSFTTEGLKAAKGFLEAMQPVMTLFDGGKQGAFTKALTLVADALGKNVSNGTFKLTEPTIKISTGKYNGVDYSKKPANVELSKFVKQIELDIDSYTKSLKQYDGQIATLKAILKQSLEKFSTSFKDSQKEKTKTDSSKKTTTEKTETTETEKDNWFIKEYNRRNHLINMEKHEVSDYLNWLEKAYKKAYKEGLITLDDYYKYTEEILNKRRELFSDHLNDVEHEISMRREYEGDNKKIHNLYTGLINDVIKKIREARKQGLTDNDTYIQELQDKYQSYVKARKELDDQIKNNTKDSIDNLVEIRQKMLRQEIEDEKDAISKKLSALKDFYDEQKQLLRDKQDEDKYLEEQAEKRKSVSDLKKKLEALELDNSAWAQKRKLELSQELTDKQKELDDFEKERAIKNSEDEYDKLYEQQEKALNKQTEALDAQLNNAKYLYDKALADIKNGSTGLYEDMIKWNNQYGDGIQKTIKTAWEEAYKALQNYRDLYGKPYKKIDLENATGYVKPQENWDNSKISDPKNANKKKTITDKSGLPTIVPDTDGSKKTKKTTKTTTTTTSGGKTKTTTKQTTKTTTKDGSGNKQTKTVTTSGSGNSGGKTTTTKTATLDDVTKRKVAAAIWNGNMGWLSGADRTKRLTEVFGAKGASDIMALVSKMVGANDKADSAYSYLNMRKKFKGYASGTSSAISGLHGIDERGTETIFQSKNGNKYMMFTGGEMVLNAKASKFLYEFATKGSDLFGSIMGKLTKGISGINPNNSPTEIRMGDIIINGNADKATVSEIRRAQRESVEMMLKEFKKLNK